MRKSSVYGYLRVSTDKQYIESGKKEITEHCKKLKIRKPTFVEDENISGKIPYNERNLGKKVICKLKQDDYVIVQEISRLSRNMAELHALIAIFKEKKVNFCSIKENITINYSENRTAEGILILSMYITFSEIESMKIQDRVKKGIAAKQEKGEYQKERNRKLREKYGEIINEYKNGVKIRALSEKYDIAYSAIYRQVRYIEKNKGIK